MKAGAWLLPYRSKCVRILCTIGTQQIRSWRIMNKFLETHTLYKLALKEIENLNRLITRKNVESLIKNLPTKKIPGPR